MVVMTETQQFMHPSVSGANRCSLALVTSVSSTLPVVLGGRELVVKLQGLICREIILASVLFQSQLGFYKNLIIIWMW